MFWAEIWKTSEFFLSENFSFLVVKFSIYLNRCVFAMYILFLVYAYRYYSSINNRSGHGKKEVLLFYYILKPLSMVKWGLPSANLWAASSKKVPSNMGKIRSSCACAKCYPDLRSTYIHFVVSNNYGCGEWRIWPDCTDAQGDLGLRCPQTHEDTFSHGPAYMVFIYTIIT